MTRSLSDGLAVKVVNVLSYVFLFGSNTYSSVAGFGGKETYLTPSPFTFYIWSIINLLLLGYVVLGFTDVGYEPIIEGIGFRFAGIAILNAIFTNLFARNSNIAAFIVALFLTSVISHAYYTLQVTKPKGTAAKLFIHLPFSMWHAWSICLLIVSAFAAFGRSVDHKAGIFTDVFVCIALALLSSTSVGYAFSNEQQGDIAGAAVIAWFLIGVYSEHRHPSLIHWFALGSFIVAAFSVAKALVYAFRGQKGSGDSERAPLIAGSD